MLSALKYDGGGANSGEHLLRVGCDKMYVNNWKTSVKWNIVLKLAWVAENM